MRPSKACTEQWACACREAYFQASADLGYVCNNPLQYSDPTGLDRYSEIANAVALQATKEAPDEGTFMKIGRVAADIAAGAADAFPIEGGLNRNAALLKATGMADTDSGVYKASYWTTTVASFAIPVGGADSAQDPQGYDAPCRSEHSESFPTAFAPGGRRPKCVSFSRMVCRETLSQRAALAWLPCASSMARAKSCRSTASITAACE